MNITFKAMNVDISDEIRDYAEKRIMDCEKLLGEYAEAALCDIELAQSRPQQSGPVCYAEANVEAAGKLYRATAEEESYEAAIDKVKDELMQEMRRDKEKREDAVKKGGAAAKEMLRGE